LWPDSSLPGRIPAHDAKWRSSGKRLISALTSAIKISAVRLSTPGDGIKELDLLGERDHPSVSAEVSDRLVEVVDLGDDAAHEEPVVAGKAALKRVSEGRLVPGLPLARSAMASGSVPPETSTIAQPEVPRTRQATEDSFDADILDLV
jgi:hypothetical protein